RPLHVQRAKPGKPLHREWVRLAARSAVQDHPARRPDCLQALLEGRPADAVVDGGHTFAPRDIAGAPGKALVADTSSAPASRASFAFSSVEVVAITRPPTIVATCVNSWPTPPAAAWTSTQSPS